MMIPMATERVPSHPLHALFLHAVVFVAVNGLLIGLWVVLVGSTAELSDVVADPSTAMEVDFWPIFVLLAWGAALLIHAGVAVTHTLSPTRRQQRREAKRREESRRRMERRLERGKAKGEELLAKTAQAAMDGAVNAVSSIGRPKPASTLDDDPMPSGTHWVAVMFTDLTDSTGLAESMGDDAWSDVLGVHRRLVRRCVKQHHGREIGTQGDGFLVRYESPAEAANAAIAIQRAHHEKRTGRMYLPDVRIGIHAGDAVHDDGDLIGQVVNIAARITSLAEPGQVLVTEQVADRLGPEVTLQDCGLHELKGISRPRHLLAVDWQEA